MRAGESSLRAGLPYSQAPPRVQGIRLVGLPAVAIPAAEWNGARKMTMRRPLVFERDRSALLSLIVEQALDEAQKRSVHLGKNYEEDRMILVRRVIGAIESGETDPGRLKALALCPEEARLRATQH